MEIPKLVVVGAYLEELCQIGRADLSEHVAFSKTLETVSKQSCHQELCALQELSSYHISKKRQSHPKPLIVNMQIRDRNTLFVGAKHILRLTLAAFKYHQPPNLNILQLRQCAIFAHRNQRLPCL